MEGPCECGIEPPGSITHGVSVYSFHLYKQLSFLLASALTSMSEAKLIPLSQITGLDISLLFSNMEWLQLIVSRDIYKRELSLSWFGVSWIS